MQGLSQDHAHCHALTTGVVPQAGPRGNVRCVECQTERATMAYAPNNPLKVYVGNLPYKWTRKELGDFGRAVGQVEVRQACTSNPNFLQPPSPPD
jgi:hypothetical protein